MASDLVCSMKSSVLFSILLAAQQAQQAAAFDLKDIKHLANIPLDSNPDALDEEELLYASAVSQFYKTADLPSLSKALDAFTTKSYYYYLTATDYLSLYTDDDHPERYTSWVSEQSNAFKAYASDFSSLGIPVFQYATASGDLYVPLPTDSGAFALSTGTGSEATASDSAGGASVTSETSASDTSDSDSDSDSSDSSDSSSSGSSSSDSPSSDSSSVGSSSASSSSSTAGGSNIYIAPLGFVAGALGIALL